jgi:hypothetical protein
MNSLGWKSKETRIAIFDTNVQEWQYFIFDTWEEAREAINAARREGKAAVFYDGATLLEPPEFFTDVNTSAD